MLGQNTKRSQVETYIYNQHPIEKSIYLSKEGEQIPPPFSHNHRHKKSRNYHLQPMTDDKAKPITISQINTSKQDSSIWDLFSCCREITTVQNQEYEDCAVCNRRVFKDHQAPAEPAPDETPYTSAYRMQSRQGQPVQVFYDRVKSHELCGQRWRHD